MAAKKKGEVKAKPEKEAAVASEPKAAKRAKKKASAEKIVFTRGKRKEAVARASVRKGSGRITINSFSVDCINNSYIRRMIYEPIAIAGNAAKELDIDVNVYGGGVMGQAEAARQAIARGIVEFTGSDELKKKMLEYDRHLLAEDSRRVEPKKYKGPKARARFQKSYR